MSPPSPIHPGLCRISQGDFHLTEFQGHAVTSLGPGEHITWELTCPDPAAPGMIFTLLPAEPHSVPHVLTLGKKVEGQEGIEMFVSPLKTPVPKSQLWTLHDVIATKRLPPLLVAHIQSAEYPDLMAGVGIINVPLPRLYLKVAAVPKEVIMDDKRWQIDYLVLKE